MQSSSQIVTTNKHPTFYRPDALPVAQPTEGKTVITALNCYNYLIVRRLPLSSAINIYTETMQLMPKIQAAVMSSMSANSRQRKWPVLIQ